MDELVINGNTGVTLDAIGDDHIVVLYLTDNAGFERDIMLPHGGFAWQIAVERARRAEAFL